MGHQKTMKINGERVTLYSINKLAMELGRTSQTVRKWEVAGFLPKALFKDVATGRRMYSQEQIDAIVRCAEEAKIRQGYSVANTSFPEKVHKAIQEVNKKYINKGGK